MQKPLTHKVDTSVSKKQNNILFMTLDTHPDISVEEAGRLMEQAGDSFAGADGIVVRVKALSKKSLALFDVFLDYTKKIGIKAAAFVTESFASASLLTERLKEGMVSFPYRIFRRDEGIPALQWVHKDNELEHRDTKQRYLK